MSADLAVLTQTRFGGGSAAQTEAFTAGAVALGRQPTLLYDPHPGLGEPSRTWRRIEALRQESAARRLAADARDARSLWVVAALAHHGGAAPRALRPYACWIGTTIGSEWAGRAPGLPTGRRAVASLSNPLLRRIERKVLLGAAALYATSASSRTDLARAAGIDERGIGLLPIPIDGDHFAPEEDELWLARLDTPMVAFLGRADDPRKNVALLLRAFELVRRELPDARLRLIGAPPAQPLGAGVEATGVVPDIVPLLRECALMVLPSTQEGFGIAVAEGLACGVPAIVTPSGGPEEMVATSGAGRVTSAWSDRELAEAMLDLLGDPASLARLRIRGRTYILAEHSPDRFRGLLEQAFRELDA